MLEKTLKGLRHPTPSPRAGEMDIHTYKCDRTIAGPWLLVFNCRYHQHEWITGKSHKIHYRSEKLRSQAVGIIKKAELGRESRPVSKMTELPVEQTQQRKHRACVVHPEKSMALPRQPLQVTL